MNCASRFAPLFRPDDTVPPNYPDLREIGIHEVREATPPAQRRLDEAPGDLLGDCVHVLHRGAELVAELFDGIVERGIFQVFDAG